MRLQPISLKADAVHYLRQKHKINIDANKIQLIYASIMRKVTEALLDGKEVTLPKYGKLKIVGRFPTYGGALKPKWVNWPVTKQMWADYPDRIGEYIYHVNMHTGGWYYKVKYILEGCKVKRANHVYFFFPCKELTRQLQKRILAGATYEHEAN